MGAGPGGAGGVPRAHMVPRQKYEYNTCGIAFCAGHPVSIPGTGAGRVTRGRAYAV